MGHKARISSRICAVPPPPPTNHVSSSSRPSFLRSAAHTPAAQDHLPPSGSSFGEGGRSPGEHVARRVRDMPKHLSRRRLGGTEVFDSARGDRHRLSACSHFNYELQIDARIVIYCHYLSVSLLGNLRACCLPWKWSPSLRRPLQNQTLVLCHP